MDTFSLDLFHAQALPSPGYHPLGEQACLLRGWALSHAQRLLTDISHIQHLAPPRLMQVPGGKTMSVAITNAGELGWISDARGYRYSRIDPQSGRPWPKLPPFWLRLASDAAFAAGFSCFAPDVCLINTYLPGTRMGLHQDKDEQDLLAPIVSVSLGMDATFQFGGWRRNDPLQRVRLIHGDVVVWGGVDRLRYHGVCMLRGEKHPLVGERRINLTFRKARQAVHGE